MQCNVLNLLTICIILLKIKEIKFSNPKELFI